MNKIINSGIYFTIIILGGVNLKRVKYNRVLIVNDKFYQNCEVTFSIDNVKVKSNSSSKGAFVR